MNSAARGMLRNRKGMEVSMLVKLVIIVVFLLVVLGAIMAMWGESNIFSGAGNICERTGGLVRGCT